MLRIVFKIGISASLMLAMIGCGKSYPSVSGKVTLDGQPASNVKVLFVPVSTKENPFPGPHAEATTATDGSFTLKTKYGSSGATAGQNVVEFYSSETFDIDYMKSELELLMMQADGDSSHPANQKAKELRTKIEKIKSSNTGDSLKPMASSTFEVPASGTDAANFELTELMKAE